MADLTLDTIADLLQPYLGAPVETKLCEQVSLYLDLLTHWSSKVSLTSIREPAEIVQRHFGESFFLAEHLPNAVTLLDFGSGAGFPGIPAALLRLEMQVTLAESQGKKAAFLREAVSELGLKAAVWAERVEKMPDSRLFDVVALRAVDRMESALQLASRKVGLSGTLAFLAGEGTPRPSLFAGWRNSEIPLPLSTGTLILATKDRN